MDSKLSDGELVRRVLEGNTDAFAVLVHRYQDVAYAVAYSIVRNFHDAKDIAQEVWIRVYQRLATYDPDRYFGSWLYTVSKRCAIDWLRSRCSLPDEELSAALSVPDQKSLPDEEQERREACEGIHQALSSLSEVNRETTVLYYINGYSQKEVSQILGVPLGTVKRRLHDSREVLRKEVTEMIKETFEKNKPGWEFTEDVVNSVSELKGSIIDHLPERFRKLGQMDRDELRERQKQVLLSLVGALSISAEEVEIEKDIKIPTAEMGEEQREYLWQTLHELELIEILFAVMDDSRFREEVRKFSDVTVQVGRYNSPGKEHHNKLYVAFTIPPGHWNQTGIED